MITTRTLGEQVRTRLKKFTTDSDITLNDTILAVQQALSDLAFARNRIDGYGFDGALYYVFEDVPVVDGVLQLPATPMAHDQAIIVGKNIMTKPFTQLPHGFASFQHLPAASIGGEIGYFLSGEKLYFPENQFGLEVPSSVMVKLLCPVVDANVDIKIMIPAEMQQLIIDTVLQRYGVTNQIVSDETKDDVDAQA
jgi:hypothetical protein